MEQPKQGPSSKVTTQPPRTGGGAPSERERPKPLPGTEKSIPIGTPLTPDQLRRLKEEAERPGRTLPGSKDTNEDSSRD
jgi:hypothetical protein